jgi:kynurenine formamidase
MYIDLTHTFTSQMPVYPGDPDADLKQISKDGIVDHILTTGMHVGTHMDAPLHMIEGGKHLSDFNLDSFIGNGILMDARGKEKIDSSLLGGLEINEGDIAVIMTGWDKQFLQPEYYIKYPELTEDFANKLVEFGVKMVGIDTPSPDYPPFNVHKILLSQNILIIENLTNLEALLPHQNFEIIALPAKFKTEAAPVRVVAKVN